MRRLRKGNSKPSPDGPVTVLSRAASDQSRAGLEATTLSHSFVESRLGPGRAPSLRCVIIHDMRDKPSGQSESKRVDDVNREQVIRVLSLEY
jgi:hypothetical protein